MKLTFEIFKKNKIPENQKVAFLNSCFTIFFNLLPFWAGILVLLSFNNWKGWSNFYGSGEFYLYSTSLISSSYLIYHNNKVSRLDWNSIFSILSLVLIVIISILYAAMSSSDSTPDNNFMKWASVISIGLAIPIFYYSQVVNNTNSPNIGKKRREEQDTIVKGLS